MLRRTSREARSKLGLLAAILTAVAALGTILVVAGGGSSASGDEGAQENNAVLKAADSVVMRVYGTQGLPFRGLYATVQGGQHKVEGELGSEPIEYEVPVGFGSGYATFQKQATEGELKAEILVNGEIIKKRRTDAEYGVVTMFYSPQGSTDGPRHPLEPILPIHSVP